MVKLQVDSHNATCLIQFRLPFLHWYHSLVEWWAGFQSCLALRVWGWFCNFPLLGKFLSAPQRCVVFLVKSLVFYTHLFWEESYILALPTNGKIAPSGPEEDGPNYESELQKKMAKIEELQLEQQEQERAHEQLRVECARKDEIILGLQVGGEAKNKKIQHLEADVASKHSEIHSKMKRMKRLESEMVEKREAMKNKEARNKSIEGALRFRESELETMKHTVQQLRLEATTRTVELEGKQKRLKQLETEVESKKGHIQQLETSISSRNTELKNKNKRIKSLEEEVELLNSQNKEVQAHLEAFKVKQKDIRLCVAAGGGNFGGADKDFVEKLRNRLKEECVPAQIDLWKPGQTLGSGVMPILLGIHRSRLVPDIEDAFKEAQFQNVSSVSLVIMHHRPKHQSKVSASRTLLDLAFLERAKVTSVADGIFWGTEGFYDCEQNAQALTAVVKDIRSWNSCSN